MCSGEIKCWGADSGAGETVPPLGAGFAQVSCGWKFCCALRANNGSLTCWCVCFLAAAIPAFALRHCLFHVRALLWLRLLASSVCCSLRGDNADQQLAAPSGAFTAVSTGLYHGCAIANGTRLAHCWSVQ